MVPNIDLKKLRAFYLVAKHGTLSWAASQLLLTIPAVSMQIRSLENELGTTLFHRVGKRLVITPQGEAFLAGIESVFTSLDEAVQSVSKKNTEPVQMSLAIGNDLTRYFSGAIAKVVQAHPMVRFSMRITSTPEILALVAKGEIDMGVGYFVKAPSTVNKHVLIKSGFSLVCPPEHPLLRQHRPSLSEIAKYRLITLRPTTSLGRTVMRAFAEVGVEPSGKIESGSCQTSQDLVEKRLGVAIIHTLCRDHQWPIPMRLLDVSRYFGSVDVSVIHLKSRRLSSAHTEFINSIQTLVQRSRLQNGAI